MTNTQFLWEKSSIRNFPFRKQTIIHIFSQVLSHHPDHPDTIRPSGIQDAPAPSDAVLRVERDDAPDREEDENGDAPGPGGEREGSQDPGIYR